MMSYSHWKLPDSRLEKHKSFEGISTRRGSCMSLRNVVCSSNCRKEKTIGRRKAECSMYDLSSSSVLMDTVSMLQRAY